MAVKLRQLFDGKTVEQLADEIDELTLQRRALQREHRDFREDGPARVAALRAEMRVNYEQLVRAVAEEVGLPSTLRAPGGAFRVQLEQLARARVLAGAEVEADLLAAIAALPAEAFSPLSRAEFEAQLAAVDEEIRACRVEIERRDIEARRDQTAAELAELESRIAS